MRIERQVIEMATRGVRGAQREIYDQLTPYLRAVATRYLRHHDSVDDVLQNAFVKIFTKMATYDLEQNSFHQWAARIVINEALMLLRSRRGKTTEALYLDLHDIAVLPDIVEKLSDEQLLAILQQMPVGYYEVFNLAIIEEYSHAEIANLLDISIATSRKRLSRARTWIKKTFRNTSLLPSSIYLSKILAN